MYSLEYWNHPPGRSSARIV